MMSRYFAKHNSININPRSPKQLSKYLSDNYYNNKNVKQKVS